MAHEKAHAIWDELVPRFEAHDDVALTRMFGTVGLGIRGKVFAFVGADGDLVAKVGEARTAALEGDGVGERKVMRDRPMREWISLQIEQEEIWADVIDEAREFVDAITPRAASVAGDLSA